MYIIFCLDGGWGRLRLCPRIDTKCAGGESLRRSYKYIYSQTSGARMTRTKRKEEGGGGGGGDVVTVPLYTRRIGGK